MTAANATHPDLTAVHDRLWTAVRAGDENEACAAVVGAVESGLDPETALLDVIGAVQLRVGTEWAANRLTVAQEHAATAIHERVVAALAHHPEHRGPAPSRSRITVACVDGEWHALPARLLAEVLRRRGWQVDFLGAHVPTPHLIAHLHQTGARVVALSATLSPHLPTAHAAITACQAVGVPVVAGGAAFGTDGRHARALGADAWAPHAREAARVLDRGLARPEPLAIRQTVDDLPHLTDQEYTMVVGTRRELLKETLVELEDRFPPMRAYSDRQRQRTAEDIGHILDHLAAALYVADEDLFSDFIAWTADVLTARDVPAHSLDPALEVLGHRLRDFPRATRILRAARDTLATHLPAPRKPGDGQHV